MTHYHIEWNGARGAAGTYSSCLGTFGRMLHGYSSLLGVHAEGSADDVVVPLPEGDVRLRIVPCRDDCGEVIDRREREGVA